MGESKGTATARWLPSATSLVYLIMLVSTVSAQSSGFSQALCSNLNTGSSNQQSSSDYMSNGKCHDSCGGYAYAIVQYQSCWCSNVYPGGAGPGSNCAVDCPGFPAEKCGDKSQGLYGYIALGPSPTSTQGGSQPSANQNDNNQATPSTTSTIATTSTSSYSTKATSTSSSSTWSPTPIMTVETVTGVLRTLTVTPTQPPQETQTVLAEASNDNNGGGFFSSPGKVAGTFVAVAIIVVGLIAALVLFFWRKRRQHGSEHLPSVAGSLAGTPQRRPSRMSSMGLLGSQKEKSTLPSIQTSSWGPGNGAEKSPAGTLDKRNSYPHITDQRLEPTAVWNPLHDNGSHVSVRSFRDDQDYSRRMLRVANPD